MDLSKLSNADLLALKSGDLSKVSDAGLMALKGQPSPQEQPSFGQMFKREVMHSLPVSMVAGGVRGAGDIGATLLWPRDKATDYVVGDRNANLSGLITGKQPISRNDERRQKMDSALKEAGFDTESLGFGAGRLLMNVAGTSGVGPILGGAAAIAGAPAALVNALRTGGMNAAGAKGLLGMLTRTAGGAVTGGVSAGLLNPEDAKAGATIGGLMPVGAKLASTLGGALWRQFSPGASSDLAKKAINQFDIPLGYSDVTDGKTVKALRSILNDAPLTGGIGAVQNEAKQAAFNKAVGKIFGAPETKLTAQVVDAAKKRMGAEFDRIWNANSLQVDPQLMMKMQDLQTVAKKLPRSEGASLSAEIDDLFNKMVPDANGNAVIPGDVANKFQSYLRRRAEGSAGLKNELGDLRGEIISAFNRSVSPQTAQALMKNREMYKAFKTVEPLLAKAEAGVAGRTAGDIPPSLLSGAVVSSYQNPAGTPLAELGQIGSKFLVDRTPQTGGSMRAALQNTAIGGALTGGAMVNPAATAMVIPAAAAANYALGSPRLAKAAISAGDLELIKALRGIGQSSLPYRAAPLLAAE